MKISRAALAALAVVGGSAAWLQTEPAQAQRLKADREHRQQQEQPQPQQPAAETPPAAEAPTRPYTLSRAEREALVPAIQAAERSDWAAAEAALPAAIAAAQGADAKYLIAQIRLRIGLGTNNVQIQAQALDELIASGGAQPSELPALYENQAQLATAAGDNAKAERAMSQLVALTPNDPNAIMRFARFYAGRNDYAGAIRQYQRVFQLMQAAGQPITEDLRKQALALAYRGRLPQAVTYARELVAAFPNPTNWRDALLIYREQGGGGGVIELDLRRLQRAAGALQGAADYVQFAEAVNRAGLPGEAKAVLEEGLARNQIQGEGAAYARQLLATVSNRVTEDRAAFPALRTRALAGSRGQDARTAGDVAYSYGLYAEAAELYRAALEKGGEDANLVNLRLGAALAMAGRRAEAEAALRAVTGPRAELAQFWLLWVSSRG